jgi:hypothetical protein
MSLCWRMCARVLRFQMATAIPPRAAEVVSSNPVRQKFRRAGAEGVSPSTSPDGGGTVLSIFAVEAIGMRGLRYGMEDPIRLIWEKRAREKLIRETCVYGVIESREYSNWNFKF